ncbi:MAG: fluoride efflux transporter CrcB [Planctomycetes bacterium]|nr:fluoride efflux transporter CrcB [Planctomycetota bacterium]
MWQKFVYLGLAGAAGTITRYWLSGVVQRNVTTAFPLGTAAVNILGCLLFGLLWAFVENRLSFTPQMRMIIFVGFFGAFTTFSSFVFETGQLLDESQWLWAAGNVLFQNIIGIICVLTGLAVGKLI